MTTLPGTCAGNGSSLTSRTSTSPVLSIAMAFIVFGNDILLLNADLLPNLCVNLLPDASDEEKWRATCPSRRVVRSTCILPDAMTEDGTIDCRGIQPLRLNNMGESELRGPCSVVIRPLLP